MISIWNKWHVLRKADKTRSGVVCRFIGFTCRWSTRRNMLTSWQTPGIRSCTVRFLSYLLSLYPLSIDDDDDEEEKSNMANPVILARFLQQKHWHGRTSGSRLAAILLVFFSRSSLYLQVHNTVYFTGGRLARSHLLGRGECFKSPGLTDLRWRFKVRCY